MELRANQLITLLGENTLVMDIDDDRVADLVVELFDGPRKERSPATVNRHVSILSKALTLGKKHKEWKKDKRHQFQVIDWGEHRQKEPKERTVFLSPIEARMLAEMVPPHISLAILWSIYAGCRLNETATLTWNRIFRDGQYCEVFAKGGEFRPVVLSQAAIKILETAESMSKGDLVFDLTNRRKHWEAARDHAGKPEFRWHDLRHVSGTWLRQYGKLDLKAVGRGLGHSNITTTDRYAHVADNELLTAFNALPDIISEVQTLQHM